ncbi:MAG: hypothetical protein U0Z17_01220 [Bacteroidales bacterium]
MKRSVSEQQTPVYYNGYIFGILPKDAGGSKEHWLTSSKMPIPEKPLMIRVAKPPCRLWALHTGR